MKYPNSIKKQKKNTKYRIISSKNNRIIKSKKRTYKGGFHSVISL